jgi:hypothetical protein
VKVPGPRVWTAASLLAAAVGIGLLAASDLRERAVARRGAAEAERQAAPPRDPARLERGAAIAGELRKRQGEASAFFRSVETLPAAEITLRTVWIDRGGVTLKGRASSLPDIVRFARAAARTPGWTGVFPVRRQYAGEGPLGDGKGLPFEVWGRFWAPKPAAPEAGGERPTAELLPTSVDVDEEIRRLRRLAADLELKILSPAAKPRQERESFGELPVSFQVMADRGELDALIAAIEAGVPLRRVTQAGFDWSRQGRRRCLLEVSVYYETPPEGAPPPAGEPYARLTATTVTSSGGSSAPR